MDIKQVILAIHIFMFFSQIMYLHRKTIIICNCGANQSLYGQHYSAGLLSFSFQFSSSDTTPLLNGSSQDRMFDTMAVEIEQLLAKVKLELPQLLL